MTQGRYVQSLEKINQLSGECLDWIRQNSGAVAGATTSQTGTAKRGRKPAGSATGTRRRGRQSTNATQQQ